MPTTINVSNDLSTGKIPEIMRVIDEIAFQTNILALQAAVGASEAMAAASPPHLQGSEPGGSD